MGLSRGPGGIDSTRPWGRCDWMNLRVRLRDGRVGAENAWIRQNVEVHDEANVGRLMKQQGFLFLCCLV